MASAEYVILDLEWNGTYSRRIKGFINEIIEFGAVKVDEQLDVYKRQPLLCVALSASFVIPFSLSFGALVFFEMCIRDRLWMAI